jgi:hypothetical protein
MAKQELEGRIAAADVAVQLALDDDLKYTVERLSPSWKSHQISPQATTFREAVRL